jgi:hypothetical protein
MKKILLKTILVLAVLTVIALVAASFYLGQVIKQGVETFGPKLTRTSVKLEKASLLLFSGSGSLEGLVVGNPEGFLTPRAISVGSASLAIEPRSLLSDKIVIRSIKVEAPEIMLETGLGGSNLGKILANVQAAAGGGATNATAETKAKPAAAPGGKKLQVDEFVITGAKVRLSVVGMEGSSIQLKLSTIQLKDLGKGPEGITSAELTEQVLKTLFEAVIKSAAESDYDLGKMADKLSKELTKDLDPATVEEAKKLGKSIGDLFKKKDK